LNYLYIDILRHLKPSKVSSFQAHFPTHLTYW
jgi:hypothetical protein